MRTKSVSATIVPVTSFSLLCHFPVNFLILKYMKRNVVVLLITALLSTTAFAQDVITFRSGDVVRAKVIEVYIDEVTYIKENNPDGPKYTVSKEDIDSIVYKNGTSDVFCSAVRKSSHKGWFFSPEIGLGIMEDFSYGLTFSTGYQFNDLFSAGAGCTISQRLEEDPAFSAFALAHFNFGHKPGHWFYECRVGADFA